MLINSSPRVYLAGPIGPGGSEINGDWRPGARQYLEDKGLIVVEPLELDKYLGVYDIEGDVAKILTDRDRRFATQSEYVLANLFGAVDRSIGTCIELAWADMSPLTTSVVVLPEENPHRHPIVESISDYIVPGLQKACEVIASLAADEVEHS